MKTSEIKELSVAEIQERIDAEKAVGVKDLDEAYDWISANRAKFAAFATCGARDPGLPILAKRVAAVR